MDEMKPAPARRAELGRGPEHSDTPGTEEFGDWYREYRSRVYRYVRWRVSGREVAEDLVATVFLRALRGLETYRRDRGSPQAWLFQIARNTVTDYLRRLKRTRGLHVSVDQIHDVTCDLPTPEERLLHEERVRVLLNAISTLRSTDQEVLQLRYGGELTNGEIGEVLGITEGAAAVRVHRALRRLQAKLTGDR